jgi:hypothetical protein
MSGRDPLASIVAPPRGDLGVVPANGSQWVETCVGGALCKGAALVLRLTHQAVFGAVVAHHARSELVGGELAGLPDVRALGRGARGSGRTAVAAGLASSEQQGDAHESCGRDHVGWRDHRLATAASAYVRTAAGRSGGYEYVNLRSRSSRRTCSSTRRSRLSLSGSRASPCTLPPACPCSPRIRRAASSASSC